MNKKFILFFVLFCSQLEDPPSVEEVEVMPLPTSTSTRTPAVARVTPQDTSQVCFYLSKVGPIKVVLPRVKVHMLVLFY